jgi:hypothetical protein
MTTRVYFSDDISDDALSPNFYRSVTPAIILLPVTITPAIIYRRVNNDTSDNLLLVTKMPTINLTPVSSLLAIKLLG